MQASAIDVIDLPEQATADWATTMLRGKGLDADVTAVRTRPIGTGQMSGTYVLELEGRGVPPRLVLKLASTDPATRTAARTGYRSEIGFYNDLADEVAIRVPECFLAVAADDGTRFTLVLEDVSPAVQGDQIAGAGVDVVLAAATNLAGLHASTWCDETLWQRSWAVRPDVARARFLGSIYDRSIMTFTEYFGDRLDHDSMELLGVIGNHIVPFLSERQSPFAAIHGDYRLDNLLLDPGGEVIAVDWQSLAIGVPGRDLAYLVATSLSIADRRAGERRIVEAYHGALIDGGVRDYDLAACVDDYVYGLLQAPLIIVIGAAMSERTDRGDDMFMAMVERSLSAIVDHERIGSSTHL
jgi:Ser/Thr protein kinase RdoA (MazF antagonist)